MKGMMCWIESESMGLRPFVQIDELLRNADSIESSPFLQSGCPTITLSGEKGMADGRKPNYESIISEPPTN